MYLGIYFKEAIRFCGKNIGSGFRVVFWLRKYPSWIAGNVVIHQLGDPR